MTYVPLDSSDQIAFSQVMSALSMQIQEISRSAEIIEKAALSVLQEAVVPNAIALQTLDMLGQRLADADATLSFVLEGLEDDRHLQLTPLLERITLQENKMRFVCEQGSLHSDASVELF